MQAPEPLSSVHMALLELLNHWRNRAHWIDVERRAIGERLQVYDSLPDMKPATPPPTTPADQLVAAVRGKNTELEVKLQEQGNAIRALHEQNVTLVNENNRLRQEKRELALQLDQLQHERPEPINTLEVSVPRFAQEMGRWCKDTFGSAIFLNPLERAARLVEEAVEVAQAVGLDKTYIYNIFTMVYNKDRGELKQGLGGVIVCWAVMCDALGINPSEVIVKAKDDCWTRQTAIRNKLAAKVLVGASPTKIEHAPGNIPGPKYDAGVTAAIEKWRKSIDGSPVAGGK
jgi:NTP pyrophosphatase (non-canonical NTP hydrolase)